MASDTLMDEGPPRLQWAFANPPDVGPLALLVVTPSEKLRAIPAALRDRLDVRSLIPIGAVIVSMLEIGTPKAEAANRPCLALREVKKS